MGNSSGNMKYTNYSSKILRPEKTYNNSDYRFLKTKKNSYILNHTRKPIVQINYAAKGKSRKSFISGNGRNAQVSDYSFDIDNKTGKSEGSKMSVKKYSKKHLSRSPARKTKLKTKASAKSLVNANSDEVCAIKKYFMKKVARHTLSSFLVLSLLGYGTFGSVILVKEPSAYHPYALKIIKSQISIFSNKKQKEHVHNEIEVLTKISKFENNFYANLVDTMQDDNGNYLLLDYVPGGELFSYLRRKLTIEDKGIKFYMAEIIVALEQLHKNNIIYRDLKPENIIIDKDGHIRLVDFGFSKILKDGETTYTSCGTPTYMAPEIINKWGHNMKSDIWALGVLLWDMIGRFTPFYDQNPSKMYNNIIQCRMKWPKNMDKIARDLTSKMLVTDPNMRISLDEIKNHMFFEVNSVFNDLGNWLEVSEYQTTPTLLHPRNNQQFRQ